MTNRFRELQQILEEHKIRLDVLSHDIQAMFSPYFEPGVTKLRSDFHNEPLVDTFELDRLGTQEEEWDRQTKLVDLSLHQMRAAVTLIEAQTALRTHTQARDLFGLNDCIVGDKQAFRNLRKRADSIAQGHAKDLPPLDAKPFLYDRNMREAMQSFKEATNGKVPGRFDNYRRHQLVQKVFDMRMDYAELAAEYSHLRIGGIETVFEDVFHIRTALQKGLVEPIHAQTVQRIMSDKLEFCVEAMPKALSEVLAITQFAAKVYEMGDDTMGEKPFKVKRYDVAGINPLTKFAP